MQLITPAALLSVQLASVLAAPAAQGPVLKARQDEATTVYENPDGGWSIITYGDGRLNYGNLVPSSTLDTIDSECAETACQPNEALPVGSLHINNDRPSDVTINIDVEGSFNPEGERGSKSDLLALAKLAFEEVYNVGVAERQQGVGYITNECPASQTNGCPGQGFEYTDQWSSTDHVNVRINYDDGSLAGDMNVGYTIAETEADPGICGSLVAAGAGAGLVNAGAGAGLILGSVLCDVFLS